MHEPKVPLSGALNEDVEHVDGPPFPCAATLDKSAAPRQASKDMELSTLAADDNWLSADSAASTAADMRSDGTTIVCTVIAGAALGPVAAQQGANEPRAASTRGVRGVGRAVSIQAQLHSSRRTLASTAAPHRARPVITRRRRPLPLFVRSFIVALRPSAAPCWQSSRQWHWRHRRDRARSVDDDATCDALHTLQAVESCKGMKLAPISG